MIIIRVLEIFLLVVLVVFVMGQIMIPGLMGRQLFPFFRKQRKLEDKLVELNQRKVEQTLQNEIKSKRNENV